MMCLLSEVLSFETAKPCRTLLPRFVHFRGQVKAQEHALSVLNKEEPSHSFCEMMQCARAAAFFPMVVYVSRI